MSATAPFESAASTDRKRSFAWPTLRQVWFQLHWLVGITAGTVLVVIGLSGATLAFREEILDAINPGVRHVAAQAAPMLSPDRLQQALRVTHPHERLAQITLSAEPGTAARVLLAPPPGVRRGETLYLDPYTAAVQPEMKGAAFFEWVESLHRWLLLPRDDGRIVAGVLSICLLGMALSGLYLRWPKHVLDWRGWIAFDLRLKGRSFLWGLHSVLGTWALLLYLVSTSTGIYWSFDVVRGTVDGWLQVDRQGRAITAAKPARTMGEKSNDKRGGGKPKADEAQDEAPLDLAPAWSAFQQRATGWTLVNLRLPQRSTQAIDLNWLGPDAPHERARHRMQLQADGQLKYDERYEAGTLGSRFQAAIYPLHMGTYFGLPGRIAMTLGALMLPVFAVTGWLLYLKRRGMAKQAVAARAALAGAKPASAANEASAWLIAYASQTGHAERLAWRSAEALSRAGHAVRVESVAAIDPATLPAQGRVLLVASSFGDGGPPDSAQRFVRRLEALDPAAHPLRGLRFGLLALGDSHYDSFCGFGRRLDAALRERGAGALFPRIEVDDGEADAVALARWSAALGEQAGARLADDAPKAADGTTWTLSRRQLLNPGSQGNPLFEITLTPDAEADWQPGALVDVVPRQPPAAVQAWLRTHRVDGDAMVRHGAGPVSLASLLARCELPSTVATGSPQALADTLKPLVARSYSVASIARDGAVDLLVRQERHANGLGLASGWLTEHAPLGSTLELRLIPNPSFAPLAGDHPAVYIGNGSGLAGLRSHLRARIDQGQRANWLLFGERQAAHDRPCGDEIAHALARGFLERVDLVFSRDMPQRVYVQDRLREAADELRAWLARDACLFVCGSLHGMSAGVDAALRDILGEDGLDDLIAAGRYRRDVY